jgi:hypothetical protein
MSRYPPAQHPADNASLRPNYGGPCHLELAFVKGDKRVSNGLWVMRLTEENRARYNRIYDSDTPPIIRIEALERAGATFYPHCIETFSYALRSSSYPWRHKS